MGFIGYRNVLFPAYLLVSLEPGMLQGQDRTAGSAQGTVVIVGRVLDQTSGDALPGARVALGRPESDLPPVWEGTTGPTGEFGADGLLPGTYLIRVEVLSFAPLSRIVELTVVGTTDIQIELAPDALELEPVIVTVTRRSRLEAGGFYERRARGIGTQLTREEIEQRRPFRVSDLFMGMPGVRVMPGGMVGSPGVVLRGGCVPAIVIDGTTMQPPVSIDDVISVLELEAIEVYHGSSSPVRFATASACGTILAWSREPGSVGGHPFSWRRLMAAAGFATLVVLLSR